jgi:hypothetical protein
MKFCKFEKVRSFAPFSELSTDRVATCAIRADPVRLVFLYAHTHTPPGMPELGRTLHYWRNVRNVENAAKEDADPRPILGLGLRLTAGVRAATARLLTLGPAPPHKMGQPCDLRACAAGGPTGSVALSMAPNLRASAGVAKPSVLLLPPLPRPATAVSGR